MTTEPWDAAAKIGLANDYLAMSEDAAYREPTQIFEEMNRHLAQIDDDRPRVIVIVSTSQGYWFSHTGGTPNSILGDLTRFMHQMMHADEDDD